MSHSGCWALPFLVNLQYNHNDVCLNISGIFTRISASLRDSGRVGSLQVCSEETNFWRLWSPPGTRHLQRQQHWRWSPSQLQRATFQTFLQTFRWWRWKIQLWIAKTPKTWSERFVWKTQEPVWKSEASFAPRKESIRRVRIPKTHLRERWWRF